MALCRCLIRLNLSAIEEIDSNMEVDGKTHDANKTALIETSYNSIQEAYNVIYLFYSLYN